MEELEMLNVCFRHPLCGINEWIVANEIGKRLEDSLYWAIEEAKSNNLKVKVWKTDDGIKIDAVDGSYDGVYHSVEIETEEFIDDAAIRQFNFHIITYYGVDEDHDGMPFFYEQKIYNNDSCEWCFGEPASEHADILGITIAKAIDILLLDNPKITVEYV